MMSIEEMKKQLYKILAVFMVVIVVGIATVVIAGDKIETVIYWAKNISAYLTVLYTALSGSSIMTKHFVTMFSLQIEPIIKHKVVDLIPEFDKNHINYKNKAVIFGVILGVLTIISQIFFN